MTTALRKAVDSGTYGIVLRIITHKGAELYYAVRFNNDSDEALVYSPDPEDESDRKWSQHLKVNDKVRLSLHQVHNRNPGTYIGKLLPLTQQPAELRLQLAKRLQPEAATPKQPRQRKPRSKPAGTSVEAFLSEEYHGCLKHAWKLARKQNPDLLLSEFTSGLVTGALQQYLPHYLHQLEGANAR